MAKINSKCPLFDGINQDGKTFKIKDHLGKKPIVIFFYPKDYTPGCTAEACSFRDNYKEFEIFNCLVIGISSDKYKTHRHFKEKYNLPFTLISDPKKTIRKLFKVPNTLFGLMPGRVSYVIDKNGIIKGVFNSQFNPLSHISNTINCLKENVT